MIPSTYGIGFARQTNRLDENFTGAFTYNWTPKKTTPLALTFSTLNLTKPEPTKLL
jgi:hypothetical protein